MLRGKDATLAAILQIIIEDEPETQDEIAEKLNISRRYVAKLLKPLLKEGAVRHPYVVDIDKLSDMNIYNNIEKPINKILGLYEKMGDNVLYNLERVYDALKHNNVELAKGIIFQDYRLNKMEDEIMVSIKTNTFKNTTMDQSLLLSTIAENIERCGDYISNIAEEIVNGLYLKYNVREDVEKIFDIIKNMFKYAIDRALNKESNYKIYDLEDELHKKLDEVLNKIKQDGCKSNDDINYYIQFGMFLKDVERFGDRCIKIFEASRDFYHNYEKNCGDKSLKDLE